MNDKPSAHDRYPAVAGQFYPADNELLQEQLNGIFATALPKQLKDVRAIISPHAGYIFSGKVAASAFNQIDADRKYARVFILASSHTSGFRGAAIYCDGDFLLPYGKEVVDTELGKDLIGQYPGLFTGNREPHSAEHSIEVQLPFLHHVLNGKCKIVPIVIGSADSVVCKRIATALKPYLTPENLFVISSDFSHYPDYENAKKVDQETAQAIIANDPEHLMSVLSENMHKHIPNLVTSLCGWTSVLTLLYMTSGNDAYRYHPVKYSNSGDAGIFGEHNRVVGYWAIALTENVAEQKDFSLSDNDKKILLNEARQTLEDLFKKEKRSNPDIQSFPENLRTKCGAFVTLHRNKKLRGCMGMMSADKPLIMTVHDMAVSAAVHDYRFSPLAEPELREIDIEISVLSPLHKINNTAEIQLGVHGVLIVKGVSSGVFLPQVATESGWDLENFLGHCARDKAGIGWEGWKNADIYIFTATVFGEKQA